MRRKLMMLLTFLCLLLLMKPVSAEPVDPGLTFSCMVNGQEISLTVFKPGAASSYVLFLPGSFDAGEMTVTFDRYDELIWDETVVLHSGDLLDPGDWEGKTLTLKRVDGARIFNLKVMRGSPIPTLFFSVDEQDLKRIHENKRKDIQQPASLIMLDEKGQLNCSDSLTSFHVRGNTTRTAPKKPYEFKLSRKEDLADMGDGKTWILLANWFDISLLRNQITLDLCRELGLRGTPECRQTDVYINGCYNGTYLLTEKIQLKKNRLNITDLEDTLEPLNPTPENGWQQKKSNRYEVPILKYFDVEEPEDVTGGYLLEIEKALHFSNNTKNAGFTTDGQLCVIIKEPTHTGLNGARYISSLVNDFHNAVLNKNGVDPSTGKHYSEFIDVDSFALKITVEEFSANFDARAASQFLYKDADSVDNLLYAGPGWDYDLTYGNKDTGLHDPTRLDYVYGKSSATANLYHWMLTHEDFCARTRELFVSKVVPAIGILTGSGQETTRLKSLKTYREAIADSAAMNFTRWGAGSVTQQYKKSGTNFDDANDFLESWVNQRMEAMENGWLK